EGETKLETWNYNINLSSYSFISQPLISHYAASQAKVLGLGKTMAAKGSERGITINLLAFGAFTALFGSMEDEEGSIRENELELDWFNLLFCGYTKKIINIMVKI